MDDNRLRDLSAGLGLGSLVLGILPAIAPRFFGRLFGLPVRHPAAATAIRSVGVRDAVLGMGLWSAATHGGKYAPWVLARALSDIGDTVAVALAIRAGVRDPRFVALGLLALGAGLWGGYLYRGARQAGPPGQTA